MFWQGGFAFHATIVVPTGREVLGSHVQQGYVTGAATHFLNGAGVVALVLWAWDIVAARDPGPVRRRVRATLAAILAGTVAALIALHGPMDELLSSDSFHVIDVPRFYAIHRWYLLISGIQFLAALTLIGATLRAWRAEDVATPVQTNRL